jgi:hypothetical protein
VCSLSCGNQVDTLRENELFGVLQNIAEKKKIPAGIWWKDLK